MFDVSIIGAGLVGPLLALLLAKRGIKVAIFDKSTEDLNPHLDRRTIAVTLGSSRLFDEVSLFEPLFPFAEPIREILVFRHLFPSFVEYKASDLNEEALGFIIEHSLLKKAIYKELKATPNIQIFFETQVSIFKKEKYSITLSLKSKKLLNQSKEQLIRCSLLVGAEGRFSETRTISSIKTTIWDYKETALVVHITHEHPHRNCAFEVFHAHGVLAVLPMVGPPNRSGIVYTKQKGFDFHKLSDRELASELMCYFPLLGQIEVNSKRWCYNLTGLKTDSLVDNRYAIVGDSAHVLHPIAGLGANLGWQDASVLAHEVIKSFELGLDIGSQTVLKSYEKKRLLDHKKLFLGTSAILSLFQKKSFPCSLLQKFGQNYGFSLVNQILPLKQWIIKEAIGINK
jgi:2-octaprenyl-6-methoxyphenol hydroxylase